MCISGTQTQKKCGAYSHVTNLFESFTKYSIIWNHNHRPMGHVRAQALQTTQHVRRPLLPVHILPAQATFVLPPAQEVSREPAPGDPPDISVAPAIHHVAGKLAWSTKPHPNANK